jgi:hypothetical protein
LTPRSWQGASSRLLCPATAATDRGFRRAFRSQVVDGLLREVLAQFVDVEYRRRVSAGSHCSDMASRRISSLPSTFDSSSLPASLTMMLV